MENWEQFVVIFIKQAMKWVTVETVDLKTVRAQSKFEKKYFENNMKKDKLSNVGPLALFYGLWEHSNPSDMRVCVIYCKMCTPD